MPVNTTVPMEVARAGVPVGAAKSWPVWNSTTPMVGEIRAPYSDVRVYPVWTGGCHGPTVAAGIRRSARDLLDQLDGQRFVLGIGEGERGALHGLRGLPDRHLLPSLDREQPGVWWWVI